MTCMSTKLSTTEVYLVQQRGREITDDKTKTNRIAEANVAI